MEYKLPNEAREFIRRYQRWNNQWTDEDATEETINYFEKWIASGEWIMCSHDRMNSHDLLHLYKKELESTCRRKTGKEICYANFFDGPRGVGIQLTALIGAKNVFFGTDSYLRTDIVDWNQFDDMNINEIVDALLPQMKEITKTKSLDAVLTSISFAYVKDLDPEFEEK